MTAPRLASAVVAIPPGAVEDTAALNGSVQRLAVDAIETACGPIIPGTVKLDSVNQATPADPKTEAPVAIHFARYTAMAYPRAAA